MSLATWDVSSGQAVRRYLGHTGPVTGLALTPDGHSLFSAADDASAVKASAWRGTVREWRVDASPDDLLAWIAANRYVPELTCERRTQYRVQPLCEEKGAA